MVHIRQLSTLSETQAAEARARSLGLTLLVLDTLEGSQAEAIYVHLGWQRVGVIPGYAVSPAGVPHGVAFYYKQLGPETT